LGRSLQVIIGSLKGIYKKQASKVALQPLIEHYGYVRLVQVPERVSTKSFAFLIIGNSKPNDVGAQGTFQSDTFGDLYTLAWDVRSRLLSAA